MDHREKMGQRGYLVTKGPQALSVYLEGEVYRDRQEVKEGGEIQEDLDLKDLLVSKANEGCKG